jgi:PBP1b-binding outer membrane lipoprotein LpoB
MHVKHITPVAVAMIVALLVSGCSQRELDCKNPRSQEEQQQCDAHKSSTESRIAPTEKPKNWLELTDPKK